MITTPRVYDATRPGEEHVLGPGKLAHAYEEGELVALCGFKQSPSAPLIKDGPRCQACLESAGRRRWVSR